MTLQTAILRAAACLVPADARAEWLAEWTAELCYIRRRSGQPGTVFCLGAFRDAFWIRRNHPPAYGPLLRLTSPVHCLSLLAFLAAATTLLAFRLPGPRNAILASPYGDAHHLVMITPVRSSASRLPEVPIETWRSLPDRNRRHFTGISFYRTIPVRVGHADLSIALASPNLFDLLNVPIPSGGTLILSDAAWRRHFGADSHVAGRVLTIAGYSAVVAGVIPDRSWRLPGRVDAWLLDDRPLAALPSDSKGFVLARRLRPQLDSRLPFSIPNQHDGYDILECVLLDRGLPFLAILMMVPLAILILPTVTSLTLGEYPANRQARRWVFLAVKIALLLPIVFYGTLDLTPLVAQEFRPQAWLIGYVVAFRWALIDQRRRCPVCLRLLGHPTRIGQLSHVFLEWYGTELICTRGHGLLHVPEIPTSSYSTQRWLQLDQSWSTLFQ
jgi:hypothetical protein